MMKVLVALCAVVSCLASAQLLRPDKMNLGVYNPDTKHYEKTPVGQDGHDQRPHGQVLLGGDGHDQQPHGQRLLGQDGHGQRRQGRPQLGQDGHDQRPHGQRLLGQDGHGQRRQGRPQLGQDGHDQRPHGQRLTLLMSDPLQRLLGQDGHDQRPHGKQQLGQDGHDQRPHRKQLLGQDGHDQQPHRHTDQLLGVDGHDQQPHGQKPHKHNKHKGRKVLGGDNHDRRAHKKHLLGQGNHDYKHHGKVLGGDDHDLGYLGLFKTFMRQHNKSYKSKAEFKRRSKIFHQNMKKVHILQQNERGTAEYGPTKFADLTEHEFRKMLGFHPHMKPATSSMQAADIPEDMQMPVSYDWRKHGIVTPIKNQGMCGSCWAFSTTGNVEGQWALKHHHLYSLSEQELVDCDTTDEGCNGGLPENAYEAIAKLGGLEVEDDYPYEGDDETCHFNKTLAKVTVNGSVVLPADEAAMAKWLTKNGPISIGINANALQFYVGGVSHPLRFLCSPKSLDHGMLIVGYGVHTYPVFKKTLPFWIIKNSWGEKWGEQGYYRVFRGDGTCGVDQMATSAIVP